MLKAYVYGESAFIEGEDLHVRYIIFDEEGNTVLKDDTYIDYVKPYISDQAAILEMLSKMEVEGMNGAEIDIIINNAAVLELIRGTSTTKNKDAKNAAVNVVRKVGKLGITAEFTDVSGDYKEKCKWSEIIESI